MELQDNICKHPSPQTFPTSSLSPLAPPPTGSPGLRCPGCHLSLALGHLGPGDDAGDGVGQGTPGRKSLLTGTAQPTLLSGLTQEGPCLWRVRAAPAENKGTASVMLPKVTEWAAGQQLRVGIHCKHS